MSDKSVSGSDPDLEPEDMEEEEEDDDDDEEEMDEDNDGDDEDDVPDDKGKSQEPAGGEDGEPKRSNSTTSTQSDDQKEHTAQNQRKASPTEEVQNNLLQKPVQLRRNIRKVLREDQLEAGTLAAQQEELERRKRLEQQRKDYPAAFPTLPFDFFQEEILLRAGEVPHLPPRISNQEVICLDSSSSSGSGSDSSEEDVGRQLLGIKDEVIELSSGEDEALQVVDSSDSTNDVDDDATAESSGSHVNDALNLPDALGRVLVNINHPPNEEDIFLASQLARAVKPHQVGGIRFLYDNLVESLERFKGSSGFGCILAHSMGLGKTLQVISFLDVLFRHTEAKTVLAIVPVNTLQNWLAEFNIWLPAPESLPAENPDEIVPRTFKVYILNDEHKTTVARAKVVTDWSANGGVLLMGYEMYRLLSLKKSFTSGRKKKPKKNAAPVIIDLDEEDRQQELLIGIEKAISRPGPDVVICDEGHRIKNCLASTSQALKNIRSRRRVVLTGYPLQNNLIEYWCMVDFVRPDFLGTRQEFSNMFERPILNGQCIDSTPHDVRLMRYRSHVLHSLLEGFVQRRGHSVLKIQLPSKEEHVILVRLSKIQRALYTEFMNRFRDAGNSGWLGLNPLKAFCVCCKIWNHPDVLHEALQKENLANEHDLDVDDLGTNASCKPHSGKVKVENNAMGLPGGESTNSKLLQSVGLNPFQEKVHQVVTYEWAKEIFCDYQTGLLENSPKMVLLFHLIEESVKLGDKILVFSQSLSTLSVIEEFLAKRPRPTSPGTEGDGEQTWVRNINYYRLDGSTSASERERLINLFNDPDNTQAWLFLLSTRAGCLGVNLIGANRVVVFDASWNPCHDAQAVCRVYRYGQKKPCHIYRLVSDYTLEKKIYDRQITKQGMSDRVVDDLNPVLNFTRREVENLLHFVEEPKPAEVEVKKFKESVIQLACLKYPHLLTREPFQHESLLIDRKEHKLTRAEKKAAKRSYEEEKRASVPYTRPSYAQYYPALDQHLTNIPAFSQRNWRPLDDKPVASVRPLQSTPIPMLPRHVPGGHASLSGQSLNFPVNYLQRAGVLVQKIVTTTDIVIPGANTTTDVQARINAGESIHIIRGTKGTYIRTNDGRIFAIRTSGKQQKASEARRIAASGSQGPIIESTSNGRHNISSPTPNNTEERSRPLSPDSPQILNELQQYAEAATTREPHHGSPANAIQAHNITKLAAQRLAIQCMTQPISSTSLSGDNDSLLALDLRGKKRKTHSPSAEDRARRPQSKHQSFEHGYTVPSGYAIPPISLNHSINHPFSPHAANQMYGSTSSSYYQLPHMLDDSHLAFPGTTDSLLAAGNTSSSAATSASASLPPFMLNPTLAGMLPNYTLPFSQPLLPDTGMFSPFQNPILPSNLPRTMTSTYPGYVLPPSGYPNSSSCLQSQGHGNIEPGDLSELGSSEEEGKDDDVIDITGK
ncbi:helicase ARIP4 [Ambystoma mexicanum]|uniref:helicase ARIP4 n=1 Tax=Ambystoma mexicanum TaxID=8296 RepID=UPI0037E81E86